MDINENEIQRISDSAVSGIESDIRERHGLLLQWALIKPEIRETILEEWKKHIKAAVFGVLRSPATVQRES